VVRDGLGWAAHGEQEGAGVEGGGGGGVRGSVCARQREKRAEWKGLEPEELTVAKTGRGKRRKCRHLPWRRRAVARLELGQERRGACQARGRPEEGS
jgi:hypothetical protein